MGTGSIYLDLPDVKKAIDSMMFDQNRKINHIKLTSPGLTRVSFNGAQFSQTKSLN